MMNPLLYPIVLPILLGVLCFFVPRRMKFVREFLAVAGSAAVFGLVLWLFIQKPPEMLFQDAVWLRIDALSGFILLASALFGFLIALYSIIYRKGKPGGMYYGSFLWTIGAACGVLLSNHLMLLLVFWGFLGITLYLLILTGGEEAGSSAKKTLVIVGGTDALILLGILFIRVLADTLQMDQISLFFDKPLSYFAYICLALGAFAKAGAMPLHTWIPDMSTTAPVSVSAYLPAALDKLLGIYLLGRMSLDLFDMTGAMNLVLLIVGAVTILAAVMMALMQHDLRRLLAYHAVSQVGYMILGIGTGTPIGIAGGLFHMLNNSLYKSCLFLTGGAVQHRAGTTDLDRLGGLGRFMPVTFVSFIIAALAISGIPPFNGFVSKWMVYQGLIELGQTGNKLWIIWLIAAMFGSGLTLASFMKLTHSIFLGVPSGDVSKGKIREVHFSMTFPMAVLALLCVVFGIFAFSVPIQHLIQPAVPDLSYLGFWSPGLATIMILVGLAVGLLIYFAGNLKGIREADSFYGGERIPAEERVTGTGFYNTIRDIPGFRKMYAWADARIFDIYDQGNKLAFGLAGVLQKLHNGVLTSYVFWMFLGIVVLFFVLMGR